MDNINIEEITYLLEKEGILFSIVKEDKTIYVWNEYQIRFFDTHISLEGKIPYLFALEVSHSLESEMSEISIIGKKTESHRLEDNLEFNGSLLAPMDQRLAPLYFPEQLYISKYHIYSAEAFVCLLKSLNKYLKNSDKLKRLV